MKNISVLWLCGYMDGSIIGIVKAWDEITKKWNFYVGLGLGKDESRDVQYIMDYAADSARWQYLGDRPAVIDFYATWCGPCRSMTPIVEEAAKRYAGDVVFYKVDIDEETELAQFFGIQSIPFFLFIPMQGTPSAQTGAMDAESFDRMVREIVKP